MLTRIQRERRTVAAMVEIYCRARHGGGRALCAECADLLQYAEARLAHCPFQDEKTPCADCTVHCYAPRQREQIRVVMRFAGPRMLWRHPLLALAHLLDGRRAPAGGAGARKPAG